MPRMALLRLSSNHSRSSRSRPQCGRVLSRSRRGARATLERRAVRNARRAAEPLPGWARFGFSWWLGGPDRFEKQITLSLRLLTGDCPQSSPGRGRRRRDPACRAREQAKALVRRFERAKPFAAAGREYRSKQRTREGLIRI